MFALVANIAYVNQTGGIGARIGRGIDEWWHIFASIAGGAMLFFAPIMFDANSAPDKVWWRIAAVVMGALGSICVVAPTIHEKLRQKTIAKELREQLLILSKHTMTPLLQKLHPVLQCTKGSGGASNKADTFREAALMAARDQIAPGNPQATANYFKYVKSTATSPAKLVLQSSTSEKPRREFILDSSELGKTMRDIVFSNKGWLCYDVDDDTPPGWDATRSRSYRTFISMSVQVGGEPEGMLTVDSDKPGELDAGDLDVARMFATLIAIAENHSRKKGS